MGESRAEPASQNRRWQGCGWEKGPESVLGKYVNSRIRQFRTKSPSSFGAVSFHVRLFVQTFGSRGGPSALWNPPGPCEGGSPHRAGLLPS